MTVTQETVIICLKNLGTPITPVRVTWVTCRETEIIFYSNFVSRNFLEKLQKQNSGRMVI